MSKAPRTSGQNTAFRRLVENIAKLPQCARSEIIRLDLTDPEHPDATTCRIQKAIRNELEAVVSIEDLTRFMFDADDLDDTRSGFEVAFAIDRILRQSLTEGAG